MTASEGIQIKYETNKHHTESLRQDKVYTEAAASFSILDGSFKYFISSTLNILWRVFS